MSGSHVLQSFTRIFDLGIHRIAVPLRRDEVDAERAEIAGVQQVVGRDLLQVVRELRAVRVRERMEDDVDLLQLVANAGSVSSISASFSVWLVDDTSFASCRAE